MDPLGAARAERSGTREAMRADGDADVDGGIVERTQVKVLALDDDEPAAERDGHRAGPDGAAGDELAALGDGRPQRRAQDGPRAVADDDADGAALAVGEGGVAPEEERALGGDGRRLSQL